MAAVWTRSRKLVRRSRPVSAPPRSAERVARGATNDVPERASRSVREIVRANVFTRINAILAVLLAIVLATGSVIDGLFGLLIIANSGVGIIQEIRAKRTLDQLAIVSQARPTVRRDGSVTALLPHEVVLDDIIELGPGDQVVVDGAVVESEGLEVDESLLTGEADPVDKQVGDEVLSGSFVASGAGAYRATKVGREAYAARLAEEASKFTLVRSELRSGIDQILKFITYLMIPAGLLIIYNQLFASEESLRRALTGMVAALVPMVPEGLVLMTSVAFAVGVIRLGRRKCLVQELPAIEGLARVDVVCADKTGTLTENGMRLAEVRPAENADETAARQALAALAAADPRPNASVEAIRDGLPEAPGWGEPTAVAPFSSAKKWSGQSFGDNGNWLLGAPDVLLEPRSPTAAVAEEIGSTGLRVLLLGRGDRPVDRPDAPGTVTPQALVVLEQRVRPGRQGHARLLRQPRRVRQGHLRRQRRLGRRRRRVVGPARRRLPRRRPLPPRRPGRPRRNARAVDHVRSGAPRSEAGDGRSAAVARAHRGDDRRRRQRRARPQGRRHRGVDGLGQPGDAGSRPDRAARQPLRDAASRGRRGPAGDRQHRARLQPVPHQDGVLRAAGAARRHLRRAVRDRRLRPHSVPFLPRHVTIAAWFTIGIPAFILSLAPNNERARSGFVKRVMRLAVPSGLIIGVATFVSYLLVYAGPTQTEEQREQASTSALITLITIALWVLAVVARPYTWWKLLLLGGSVVAYVILFAWPFTRDFFALDPSNVAATTSAFVCGAVGIVLVEVAWTVTGRLYGERRRLFAADFL